MTEHYLVTIALLVPADWKMHAYVMCPDKQHVLSVVDEMMEEVEKKSWRPLGVILQTGPLDAEGIAIVRAIVNEFPESREMLVTATNFHKTAWVMPDDDPRSKPLMDLH